MIAVAALALGALALAGCGSDQEPLEPLTSSSVPAPAELEDAIALNMVRAVRVDPPFLLRADAAAPGGLVLALREGTGSRDQRGRARFQFSVPEGGAYRAWLRARWADSCGNSLALSMDGSPTATVEDGVYGAWHWLNAGRYDLSAGDHTLTFAETEDGIELSQIILTRDARFQPGAFTGAICGTATPRRFADDFMRSPGHGLGQWDVVSGEWQIEFSYDPNAIPNQFSLVGGAGEDRAVAMIAGRPWNGCRLSFSVQCPPDGAFGALLERSSNAPAAGRADEEDALQIGIETSGGRARLSARGAGLNQRIDTTGALQPGQWHRVVIERWAWVLRVFIDGREALSRFDVQPHPGAVGLFVADGRTAFDDVELVEIPWQADDGGDLRIPWSVAEDALWFRPTSPDAAGALVGRAGGITVSAAPLPVHEVVVEAAGEWAGRCAVEAAGLAPEVHRNGIRAFRLPEFADDAPGTVTLRAPGQEIVIRRVAIRYGTPPADERAIWAYDFSRATIQDPAEFQHFTPEELAAMARSPQASKLRRRPHMKQLIGAANTPWVRQSGNWRVDHGVVIGVGSGALLRHEQEIVGDVQVRLRLRALTARSAAEIELHGGPEPGPRVRMSIGSAGGRAAADDVITLDPLEPGRWHELHVRALDTVLTARLDDGQAATLRFAQRDGGGLSLRILSGQFEFDDVEFSAPRRTRHGGFYTFERRETEWVRTGGQWIDHGGIACAFASRWVSLIAPRGEGMLWNRRAFGPDVLVGVNVEENGEWFGWGKSPDHVHYPFDNIRVALSPDGTLDRGYRLEVNARNRSRTVLYRDGVEVAAVRQDSRFPIRYVGGHAPYQPRKNRVTLVKRGAVLRAIINGREVLRYTDPKPLNTLRAGIGGYRTRVNFSYVQVRDMSARAAGP